jgi:hypothetical protein
VRAVVPGGSGVIGTRSPAAGAHVVQGRTVTLPVEVRDATSMSAMFLVRAPAVRRLIPDSRLHVPELFPGRTLCIVAAIEYRDNDLGQYNEVSVAFFVTHAGRRPLPFLGLLAGFRRGTLGAYIHRLPVTTSFSRDAGRDIWGFPKFVADIAFRDEGHRRICTLTAGGTHVLTFTAARGGRRRMPPMPQDAWAWRDGVLRRTPSAMGGEGVGVRLGGATLALGEHPIAAELRGLRIPRRALLSTWVERMRARFDAPQIV